MEKKLDAVGAYTQASLEGEETWITIPHEYWPREWKGKYTTPVVKLVLNLYGHPKAGLYWERHCTKALKSLGWIPVKGWECLFKHPEYKLFLSVYVDDFKMAGKKSSLAPMWEKLQKVLDLDPPVKMDGSTYLGCRQKDIPVDSCIRESMAEWRPIYEWCARHGNIPSNNDNADTTPSMETEARGNSQADTSPSALPTLRGVELADVRHQICQHCDDQAYHRCDLCGQAICTRHSRPFAYWRDNRVASRICPECDEADRSSGRPVAGLEEFKEFNPILAATNRHSDNKSAYVRSGGPEARIKAYEYNMTGHAQSAIDKYLELSGLTTNNLKPVPTPCIDGHMLSEEDFQTKGKLSPIAARVVLTALYLARHNRPDIYWSVNHLARNLTKWSVSDDKRLHRLICWLHYTQDCIQFGYVGDHIKDCLMVMFCDASFAGDLQDSKSTGGSYIYLIGPNTLAPISWACKKQGAVSHSSTEAEIITLDFALRMEGLPILQLWEEIVLTLTGSQRPNVQREFCPNGTYTLESIAQSIDYVPHTLPPLTSNARLVCLEDNDAVIKMSIKGRTNKLRHVTRTHRIDLDWLFEVLREDPGVNIKYINTKRQVADIFTKGQFTSQQF